MHSNQTLSQSYCKVQSLYLGEIFTSKTSFSHIQYETQTKTSVKG